jgi:protein involved in polysaccharide export with SLBB domain
MGPWQNGWSWRARALAVSLLALLSGCASHLDRALLADHNPAAHQARPDVDYCIHCPDVLEVILPHWKGEVSVGPDGRVTVEGLSVRVDGETQADATRQIAAHLGTDASAVRVRVVGFNSQQLYVHGEVVGLQRAVAYRGSETVIDLLQRVGGIAPGAAPGDIQVVRSHVADGRPPEVFHVKLEEILKRGDQSTNVSLQPFDQIYIGQSRRDCVACCLPPWLRSLFGHTPTGTVGEHVATASQ